MVGRQPCGNVEGFRERVGKLKMLERNMPKFNPVSEKKKKNVTPIRVCAQKGRETRCLGKKRDIISLKRQLFHSSLNAS